MKNFIQKSKVWIKEHQDFVVGASAVAGVAAVYAGVIVLAVKVDKAQREADAATWQEIGRATSQGASVLPGPDGSYWLIGGRQVG
jgi:hypothetical protein